MRNNDRLTSVEIQAVTVDDAIRLALDQLGLGREDVDIEILVDAGTEEDEEALVRVTAKGMASQPVSSTSGRPAPTVQRPPFRERGDGQRRQPGPRRLPGHGAWRRGAPPPRIGRAIDPSRVEAEDEAQVKQIVND